MALKALTIGDLANETGTKVETIRYYERIGLLTKPSRTAGNYRSFRAEDLNRLSFIRRARDLGFSLSQVRALLGLADQRDRSCEAIDWIAREHLIEVKRKIGDLTALRRELASIISQCGHGTVAECRIIEALLPSGLGRVPKIAQRVNSGGPRSSPFQSRRANSEHGRVKRQNQK